MTLHVTRAPRGVAGGAVAPEASLLPRGAVAGALAVLLAVILGTAAVRHEGASPRQPDAAAVATRALHFSDRSDGGVDVVDAASGRTVETVHGEAGFLRGALRALVRERLKRGLGPAQPFELVARADGRLTLQDPVTGERLDLESFGPTNAAVFARLLAASAPTPRLPAAPAR